MPAPSPSSTTTDDARSMTPTCPRIGVHGLRHTRATLALRAGVPIEVVSQRIGHADPAVTMQVYSHALDGDDATAAETTATAIFGDR
jgi:integrase